MTASSRRQRAPTLLLTLCLILLALSPSTVKASIWDDPIVVDGYFVYTIFISSNTESQDGPSGIGSFCRPGISGSISNDGSVVFSAMCGRGSAIRCITLDGSISTLAGSLTSMGYADGPGSTALFRGSTSGDAELNGLTRDSVGNYYLADSYNNAVRRITPDGSNVSTFVSSSIVFERLSLNRPTAIAPLLGPDSRVSNLYFSDQDNKRIFMTPILSSGGLAVLTLMVRDVFTSSMVLSKDGKTLYYVSFDSTNPSAFPDLLALPLGGGKARTISSADQLRIKNSIILSQDDSEIYFISDAGRGTGNAGPAGIYSISVDASSTDNPTLVVSYSWGEPGESLVVLVGRADNSLFAISTNSAYIVSSKHTHPPDSSSSGSSSSSSSSSSGDSSSSSSSSSGGFDPHRGRYHGIAAFPKDALPYNDSCLMSQLYYWMREDAEIAYDTTDYYSQFVPLDDPDMAIYGDVNVSSWCSNITARESHDGSIEIVDFWGPKNFNSWMTQDALANSPWYWTRMFLDGLRQSGIDLGNFCFYNCTYTCEEAHASPTMCIDYRKPPSCDGVCKGAIVSSVVLGAAGVVLIVLMIVSPTNLFTALVMIPVI